MIICYFAYSGVNSSCIWMCPIGCSLNTSIVIITENDNLQLYVTLSRRLLRRASDSDGETVVVNS